MIDDFKARFPEIDPELVDQQMPILESVWPCYYKGSYTKCNKEIILNLIAHLMVISTRKGSGFSTAEHSRSVDGVSVTRATRARANANTDFFNGTRYGEMFLFLTASRGPRVYFV